MPIVIKKNGFFSKEWNSEKKKYLTNKITTPDVLLRYWREPVEIGKVTFKEFLSSLLDLGEYTVYLIECITNHKIWEYIPDFKKKYKKEPNIAYMSISKCFETMDLGKYNDPPDVEEWLEEAITCSGVSSKLNEDGKPELYGIEFLDWGKLLHLPIVIKDEADLWVEGYKKGKFYPKIYGSYFVTITFGEFINALFDELAFFGSPGNRDEEFEKLKKSIKDIDEGKVELIPWEEIKEKFKKL